MKVNLLISVAVLSLSLSLGFAQSTTVNFSAGLGQRDVWYNDAPLANGNQVLIGTFSSGFDYQSHLGDLSALASGWNTYGATLIEPLLGESGRFLGSQSMAAQAVDPFAGQKIWMWILKTVDDTVPATDYRNVTAYGLYSSSGWLFPSTTTPPGNTLSINSDQVTAALFGSYNDLHLALSPVPEPSVMACMLLGLSILLLGLHRRGKRQ
jgi:hypothetical protein